MQTEHQMQIRVRYKETDGQGRVHHANYLIYFESARVEMLRDQGHSYRDLEQSGRMLVVTEFEIRYHQAAQFDDLLTITTRVARAKGVRIEHTYEVLREDELLVEARSVVACVDRNGKPRRLPDWLGIPPRSPRNSPGSPRS